MISWKKKLNRKSFDAFIIPASIRKTVRFKDGRKYKFKITAGEYSVINTFKVTSGAEIYIPVKIQEALKKASKNIPEILFEWDEANSYFSDFEDEVEKCLRDTSSARKRRLRQAKKQPQTRTTSTIVYIRNPDVVAEVLERAAGKCESCKEHAPFKRKSNGRPYLEVHHIIRLADGGDDTVKNAQALCPNCHRQKHFG